MKTETLDKCKNVAVVIVAVLLQQISHTAIGAEQCPTNSSGPDICVDWDGVGDPLLDIHFAVDYGTDPSNPSVTLFAGAVWNVRSENADSTPGNIGAIKIDATVLTDDFTLTIANGANPGAANVGSLVLDDTNPNWTGFSSISGGRITGSMAGNLTVVQDSGGAGGECSFAIDGNVGGNITIPTIPYLGIVVIGGDLSGNVTVSNKIDGGTLRVEGKVDVVTIRINDMTAAGSLLFNMGGVLGELTFAADLVLENGVSGFVFINGTMQDQASVDLNGKDVTGSLDIAGGTGSIINGGKVGGSVFVALDDSMAQDPNSFSGTATFASVAAGGVVRTEAANVDGTIHITGDMSGTVAVTFGVTEASGHLLPGGKIWVEGHAPGWIYVSRDAQGDIQIDQDVTGTGRIEIGEDLTGQIHVIGNVANGTRGDIQIHGNLGGRIDVDGFVYGDIAVSGDVTSTGRIDLGADLFIGTATFGALETGGLISIQDNADLRGTVTVTGACNGQITVGQETFGGGHLGDGTNPAEISVGSLGQGGVIEIWGDVKNLAAINVLADCDNRIAIHGQVLVGARIDIDGALTGEIEHYGDLEGTILIGGAVGQAGLIKLNTGLAGTGLVDLSGLLSGRLLIGDGTAYGSLIHLKGGLDSLGAVTINA
ncbi:MAG: hypothetical protein V3W34_15615, partial [Phycisphaerae bacterium]